jgi:DNA-binding XRE family transcriptional regulator
MMPGRVEVEMDKAKKRYLERKGWKVGTAAEFLKLTVEEQKYIELKMALARRVKAERQKHRLTQSQAARVINSSQARVARMEAGDPSVSLDRLVRAWLALGANRREVENVIAPAVR